MSPFPSRAYGRVACALCAFSAATLLVACGAKQAPPEPERAVRTLVVQSGDASLTREYAAEVRARTESRLSFRVGGKLLKRMVNLGDTVRPGQALAQLDGRDLALSQDAARAAIAAARTQRDQVAVEFKRFQELRAQGFISAAELDRREAALKSAQAQYDQAAAQGGVQSNQLGYTVLTADVAGVVTGVEAEPGMVVGPGTPIVRVAVDGPRDVVFAVPEDQITQFREAASREGALRMRLWGEQGPGQPLQLRELAAAADPMTRTFVAKADMGVTEVRIGQTATVLLTLPPREQVMKVPLTAVFEQQGRTVVWVLDGRTMQVAPQAVNVGGAEGNQVVITGGLKPGHEIVTAGVHVLTPGQRVRRYQSAAPLPASSAASR